MLTVVGEITESEVHSYQDRRTHRLAYRLDTTLSTDGPSLRMTFFAKAKHVSDWHAGRLPVGRRGIFIGQVSTFRGQWQLTNPTMALFGVDDSDETFGAAVASIKALFPLYPQTKGVDSWDLQRAIAFALTIVDDVPDPLPAPLRAEHDLPDLMTASGSSTPPTRGPRSPPRNAGSASTRRWSPSSCWPDAVQRSPSSAARLAPAVADCSRRSTSGCRSP